LITVVCFFFACSFSLSSQRSSQLPVAQPLTQWSC
jgi:hypothetical protein